MRQSIRFIRNGQVVELEAFEPTALLLDYLRDDEGSTGTKEGCGEGDCGACTIALGRLRKGRLVYEPVNACIQLLGQVDGTDLVTVEDLAEANGTLHPVQQAMVDLNGSQCGFCTPGIVMSLYAHYRSGGTADEDTVLPKWGWVSHVEGHGRHAHLVKTWEIIGYTAPVAKNWLHSWLLDSADNTSRAGTEERAAPGKVVAYGDTDDGPDNFTSWVRSDKAYIGTYTDDHGGPGGDLVTLTYTFSTLGLVGDLAKFVDHGSDFALGFDPDCHYDYRCASFVIKTCKRPHVPDGGTTLALLGFGLVALSSFKRLLHA